MDDAIREIHGMKTIKEGLSASRVTMHEGEQDIILYLGSERTHLSVWQARYMARKLYRLARRIEARSASDAHA